jgi:hypothetical protein
MPGMATSENKMSTENSFVARNSKAAWAFAAQLILAGVWFAFFRTWWNCSTKTGLFLRQAQEATKMADHWRHATPGADAMRGTGKDEAAYAAGWTVSGLATLATILVVWVFAIWAVSGLHISRNPLIVFAVKRVWFVKSINRNNDKSRLLIMAQTSVCLFAFIAPEWRLFVLTGRLGIDLW